MAKERTDSERLDWMARFGATFNYVGGASLDLGPEDRMEGGSFNDFGFHKVGIGVPRTDDYGYHVYDAPTIREAIDKAIEDGKGTVHLAPTHSALRKHDEF